MLGANLARLDDPEAIAQSSHSLAAYARTDPSTVRLRTWSAQARPGLLRSRTRLAQHLSVFAIDDILQATKPAPANDSCQHPARVAPNLAFEI